MELQLKDVINYKYEDEEGVWDMPRLVMATNEETYEFTGQEAYENYRALKVYQQLINT